MTDTTFLTLVDSEAQRARRKFPHQEQTLTLAEWLAVLTEEVGEVARDINDAPRGDAEYTSERLDHMMEELVQVGAMALRMYKAAGLRWEVVA